MNTKFISTLLLTVITLLMTAPTTLGAVDSGRWKAYMAYHDVTEVEQGTNMLYVLASGNLYTYNTHDQELRTYDKTCGLSDCGIAHIAWNQQTARLLIVYDNQNLDLLSGRGSDDIVNLPDYYSKSITEDKTVYSLYSYDKYVYLCTGFGMVKVNMQTAEISESYNLGFKVDYCYIQQNYIYAAAPERGLFRASLQANLIDKTNWTRVGDFAYRYPSIDPELLATVKTLNPGGPKYNNFACLRFYNGRLYSVGGGYTVVQDLQRPGCVQVLKDGEWQTYEDDLSDKIGGNYFIDVNSVDIDPLNENHVFASGRTGIFEFLSGQFVRHYSYDNSALVSTYGTDKKYVVVHSIKFDGSGNLWCANSINKEKNLLKLSPDGQWTSLFKSPLKGLTNLSGLMFDSRGLLWMVNNSWKVPSLYCYQPSTDAMNSYTSFVNEDGTSVNVDYVRCVAEDLSGNIWIGTVAGPLMFEPSEFNQSQPVFQQVKVPRNDGTNYADYLLAGVDISAIAIDGAGRKWFGTNGAGVYLISEDNMTQLAHFTASNSALLADYIESIAIDDRTGEVYIGTSKGLCSYRGGATAPVDAMNKDVTYAYPNPVRPDYTGPITIVGLTYNADVKIVTANGTLVAQGRSNGGTFEWDGCDTRGRRVASGVYMVQTATADGSKGTVCKIAVVN